VENPPTPKGYGEVNGERIEENPEQMPRTEN